jgi:hypothetical protein
MSYSNQKTIVLLPPHEDLLNRFCKKKKVKKIVWKRKHKYEHVIALDEWDNITILRILYIIPMVLLIISIFLLVLLFVGPYYFINKKNANRIFDKVMDGLPKLIKERKDHDWTTSQNYADEIICNKDPKSTYRILFLHEKEASLLSTIDKHIVADYIDQIWMFKHTAELFEKIIKEGYQNPFSKIIDFDIISSQTHWTSDSHLKNQSSNFEWLSDIDLYKLLFFLSGKKSLDGKKHRLTVTSPRITLKPNDFLDNKIVFYFESEYNEPINRYLSFHYSEINVKLGEKGMRLLYFPTLNLKQNNPSINELTKYLVYKFPHLFTSNSDSAIALLKEIFSSTNNQEFYSTVAGILGITYQKRPCFIHSVEIETEMVSDRSYLYSIYEFSNFDDDQLEKEINRYLEVVDIPRENVCYSLVKPNLDDPDDNFAFEGNKISDDLKNFIANLHVVNDEKLLIDSLMLLISKLKDTHPDLCYSLNHVLSKSISHPTNGLSRLYIDDQYRIFLVDYDNLEIVMTPLQKTLYLFFLQNKDGIKLKEISSYKKQLIDLYGKVGNRTDIELIKNSINDLTDATSNSINEKCSKIKEAFVSKIDDSIAKNYYITGFRSENKRILIDRSLVKFHQKK